MLRTFDHREPSFLALTRELSSRGGRFLAHADFGSADHFHLNLLPALAGRDQLVSYGRGYHDTLSRYYVEHVKPADRRAALELWNVQQLVVRGPEHEPVDASIMELAWINGPHRLYATDDDWGWFDFVHTPLTIRGADYKVMRPLVKDSVARALYQGGAPPHQHRCHVQHAGGCDRKRWTL